jgi:DNA-binding GntR family transcriptional regulator
MTPREGLAPSVPEAIERVLRERILAGEVGPDAPLREAALASEFDVSRNTIREALLLLEHAGLVDRRAHRGSRVTPATAAHLKDVMAFRKIVEPGALRGIDAADPAVAELLELAGRLEAAAADEDWQAYGVSDRAFHTRIVATGGSPRLTEMFANSIQELRLHFHAYDRGQPPGPHSHVAEHRAIVEALRDGETERAVRILDGHLRDAETLLGAGATSR